MHSLRKSGHWKAIFVTVVAMDVGEGRALGVCGKSNLKDLEGLEVGRG